jgi:hypothetical protein
MDKKGLSNIVATILIVLLALAAVAIVWGFLRPTFTNTGTEVGLKSQCFNVDVQPIICTYTNIAGDVNHLKVTATAKNVAGRATEIIAILNGVDGATVAEDTIAAPDILGTAAFDLSDEGIDSIEVTGPFVYPSDYELFSDLTVAGIVSDDSGNKETCQGTTIACTYNKGDCAASNFALCDTESACVGVGGRWCDEDGTPASACVESPGDCVYG